MNGLLSPTNRSAIMSKPLLETFPRRLGPTEVTIGFDSSSEDDAPIDLLSWVNSIRVSTPQAERDGESLPAKAGYNIERHILAPIVEEEEDARLVGSVAAPHSVEWFIYSAEPCHEKIATAIGENFPELEIESSARQDERWSVYREFLRPGPIERHLLRNRRQLRELEAHGVEPGEVRTLAHTLWFTSSDDRNAFAEQVTIQDFELHYPDEEIDLETAEEDVEYGLTITREEFLEIDVLDDVARSLFKLAASHGGEYEGWHV